MLRGSSRLSTVKVNGTLYVHILIQTSQFCKEHAISSNPTAQLRKLRHRQVSNLPKVIQVMNQRGKI